MAKYKVGDYLACKSSIIYITDVMDGCYYYVISWRENFMRDGLYIYSKRQIDHYYKPCDPTNILKATKILRINNKIVKSIEERSKGRRFRKYGITILQGGYYVLQERTPTFLVINTSLKGIETTACFYTCATGLKAKDYKFLKESTLSLVKELSRLWKETITRSVE